MDYLTSSDFRTSTWDRLEKQLEDRLKELRESNDQPSKTEIETALIRGRISMVKELLALSQDSASAEEGLPGNGDSDPSHQ